MCRPSRLTLEGRSCVVMIAEPGSGGRGSVGRESQGQGGLLSVSPEGFARTDGAVRFVASAFRWQTCTTPSNPVAQANRAYGKTVWSWPSLLRSSPGGGGIGVNRRGVGDFRRGEGGQNELGSRESAA